MVDLVAGSVTHQTLAAGRLERTVGMALGEHLEISGNPFLDSRPPRSRPPEGSARDERDGGPPRPTAMSTTPSGPARGLDPTPTDRVWFVPGLVEVPGTSGLLPEQVAALLDDLDTRLRLSTAEPGTADGPPPRRRRYRPGKDLAARVRARDLHCRFPGCSVPARRCHLDHVTPHPMGATEEANLHALCPAHHGFKHHAGWTPAMTPDGTCTWTAPTGRTHTTHPGSRHDDAA